jgi:hypothetical protein
MSIRSILTTALIAFFCLQARAEVRCNPYSVRGTYAISYRGSVYQFTEDGTPAAVALPVVLLGTASVSPISGALSGSGNVTVGPHTMTLQFAGSVELRSNCTATATYLLQPEGAPAPSPVPVVEEWVVLDGGDRIKVIVKKFPFGQQVTLGTWERVAHP